MTPRSTFVIDCVMPPGTLRGAALGRMVRSRGTKLPMIFITAHPDITAAEGELPGPVLRKPIELSALYTARVGHHPNPHEAIWTRQQSSPT
jgi:FixJ family two-component response regulator